MSFGEIVLVAETSFSNVKNFIILWLREGLTFSNKDNSAYFSGEKRPMKHSGLSIFVYFKTNLVLVVMLVRKSKDL